MNLKGKTFSEAAFELIYLIVKILVKIFKNYEFEA